MDLKWISSWSDYLHLLKWITGKSIEIFPSQDTKIKNKNEILTFSFKMIRNSPNFTKGNFLKVPPSWGKDRLSTKYQALQFISRNKSILSMLQTNRLSRKISQASLPGPSRCQFDFYIVQAFKCLARRVRGPKTKVVADIWRGNKPIAVVKVKWLNTSMDYGSLFVTQKKHFTLEVEVILGWLFI